MKTHRLLIFILVLFFIFPAFSEAAEDLEAKSGGSTVYIAKVQLPELLSKHKDSPEMTLGKCPTRA